MNTININEIGVIALSRSEEYDISGGWSWEECLKEAAMTGLAAGLGAAAVSAGAGFGKGFVAGAFVGALIYTGSELWDMYFVVE